jgi:transcriptional regulator with XRE-family HTH domain
MRTHWLALIISGCRCEALGVQLIAFPAMGQPLAWAEYVRRVTPGMTQAEIADVAGVDQAGVSRWLGGRSVPRIETAIRFARNLGRSPVEVLVAAGYLTAAEAGINPNLQISVRGLDTDVLLAEIRRRVEEGQGPLKKVDKH